MIGIALLLVFPVCLVVAAIYDVTSLTIPNWISLVLFVGFIFLGMATGLDWTVLAFHVAFGLMVLALGFGLFAAGVIGGGDAKLLASSSLWIGSQAFLPYLVLVALAGGILTVALMIARRFPLPQPLAKWPWVAELYDSRETVPYGVAIAVGGLAILTQTSAYTLVAI